MIRGTSDAPGESPGGLVIRQESDITQSQSYEQWPGVHEHFPR